MSENQSEQPEAGDVIVKASSLSGRQVENRAGEVIGIVKDMVLDLQHSRVQYVVISIGGALNVGDELIAVPTRVLSVAHNGEHVVFDASNKQIEQAQRIGDQNWPSEADLSAFEDGTSPGAADR
jgi:sporulation protein YlmC with PRC-barrel domain